jgi:hypothetical protein
MSMVLWLQLIETAAVVLGVLFGLIQLRQIRLQREAEGAAEMLRSLQTAITARAALLIFELPDNLSGDELKGRLGADFEYVSALMATFESLGPLVARGHIPLQVYADYYRGATVLSWRRLRRYIEEQRADGWPNLFEWFQWLAEIMQKRAPLTGDVPAFEKYRAWRVPADYERIRRLSATGERKDDAAGGMRGPSR